MGACGCDGSLPGRALRGRPGAAYILRSVAALRILYLNYGPQSGVTGAVTERLRGAGHDVTLFDPVEGFLYKRSLGRLTVPNLAVAPMLATAAAMARFGRDWKALYLHTCWGFDRLTERCGRAIAAARPDVVLQAGALFGPGRGSPPYYLYCDHTRALNEAYSRVPGLPPPIPFHAAWRRRETAVYRGAATVFTMSEHARRSLARTYGVDPGRVEVVGAGPNVSPAGPPVRRPRPGAFLFVGKSFVPKGGPELLQAFAAVRAHHPAAELWMAGGEQPARAPAGVSLLGRVGPERLAVLYARAGAFVLPTLREAFGLAFLEAMSFGLPCIGSRLEAIPEIVSAGETGLLVPPRDPAALAAAMRSLLDDPARAAAMGEAGRARVEQRFGWDRAVRRILDVIEAGASGRARAPGRRPRRAETTPGPGAGAGGAAPARAEPARP